jgi:tetratricopeptide (TPR) repeat protein
VKNLVTKHRAVNWDNKAPQAVQPRLLLVLRLACCVFSLLSVSSMRSAHAESAAAGRVHAQKAATLAEQGKCKAAVIEYTKAYDVLKDPAILFNRAECQRKLGHIEPALSDYEHFLAELPKAPNRSNVESRIVELKTKLSPPSRVGGAAHAPKTPPVVAAPAHAPIPDDDEDTPPTLTEKDLAWSPPNESTNGIRLGRDQEELKDNDEGVSAWVWVCLGAVVIAAGVTVGVLTLGKRDTEIPESGLGNYKF